MAEELQKLSNKELRRQMNRYRLMTLPPIILGLLLTLFLIHSGPPGVSWGLLYFLLIVVLMPAILKSGNLHREWKRRKLEGTLR